MKSFIFFLLVFFLILGCDKKSEPAEEQMVQPAKEAETEKPQEKKVEETASEETEETVDISNELKKLRIVPDENNLGKEGKTCLAYKDADGDGFGDENDSVEYACGTDPKVGYTEKKGDCDDRNRYVNPSAVETCNGDDDNCDGVIDPEDADGCNRYYKDMDGDGVGIDEFKCLCVSKGVFATLETGDCDDSNKNVHQNAREVCNDIDDNCNGQIDEGENLKGCRPFYYDKDGDGYGYQSESRCLCKPDGLFRADVLGDCNDNNININPGAVEIFDRMDNNCNGAIDENVGIKPKHKDHHGKYRKDPRKHHPKKRKEQVSNEKPERKPPRKQHVATQKRRDRVLTDNREKKKKPSKKQHVSQSGRKTSPTKDDEKKKKKPKKNSAVIF